ncbi:imm11 family protein [Vibrio mexicanus]|uniref:imm11 family protein n=1 Tax=Vibrio mexicanus TaxID=1004326 RepID=UPI00063C276D|nr:DUF1629 domain-containing protein [Vibrio mexicanus]
MNHDQIYYVMAPNYNAKGFKVVPTESTALRRFHYKEQVDGESALQFESKSGKVNPLDTQLLFCTPSILISDSFEDLLSGHIYGGKLYPAIVDDLNDSFFLVNFYDELDCWDREKSTYEQHDPEDSPHVIKYVFDENVLNSVEESERLIFRMGGDDLSPIIVHKSIKKIIESEVSCASFYSIADYELGDEY